MGAHLFFVAKTKIVSAFEVRLFISGLNKMPRIM